MVGTCICICVCSLLFYCAKCTGFSSEVDRPCLDQSGTTSKEPLALPLCNHCHHQLWQKAILRIHNQTSCGGFILAVHRGGWILSTKRTQTRIGTFQCGKTFTGKAEFAMHNHLFACKSFWNCCGFNFLPVRRKLQTKPYLPLFLMWVRSNMCCCIFCVFVV